MLVDYQDDRLLSLQLMLYCSFDVATRDFDLVRRRCRALRVNLGPGPESAPRLRCMEAGPADYKVSGIVRGQRAARLETAAKNDLGKPAILRFTRTARSYQSPCRAHVRPLRDPH